MVALNRNKGVRKHLFLPLAVLILCVGFSDVFAGKSKYCPSTKVATLYGDVQGYVDVNNTLAWKSIPYAAPPSLFAPPEAPATWEGVLETKDDCQKCTQLNTARTAAVGSQDCLYLNIWRPNTDEKNLPVFFWIHGGGNNSGSIQDFNGAAIAARSNVVFVSVQYRLGPYGYLTHPDMRDGEDPLKDSGNFGLLDIIRALEWVQNNIAAFGGKAKKVTIAGESAGGRNVLSLIASPLASGLFHRAISQSGSTHTLTMEEGDEKTENTLAALLAADGLTEVPEEGVEAYLENQPAEELFLARIPTGVDFSHPQGDGVVLAQGGPIAAIRSGSYNKVPVILGSNRDEMKYFMPHYGFSMKYAWYVPSYGITQPIPSGTYSWSQLLNVLGGNLLLDDVLPTEADRSLYEACAETGSLKWRFAGVDNVARLLRKHQKKVYAYQLGWDGNDDITQNSYSFIYGAAHATDIPFFFGSVTDVFGGAAFAPLYDTPGRKQLSETMMDYVGRFVRSGNPNCSDLPVWKKWSNKDGKPKTIVFDASLAEQDIYMISEEITLEMVSSDESYAFSPVSRFWRHYWNQPSEVRNALFFFDWKLL